MAALNSIHLAAQKKYSMVRFFFFPEQKFPLKQTIHGRDCNMEYWCKPLVHVQ